MYMIVFDTQSKIYVNYVNAIMFTFVICAIITNKFIGMFIFVLNISVQYM